MRKTTGLEVSNDLLLNVWMLFCFLAVIDDKTTDRLACFSHLVLKKKKSFAVPSTWPSLDSPDLSPTKIFWEMMDKSKTGDSFLGSFL